jgi:hypothetical protein
VVASWFQPFSNRAVALWFEPENYGTNGGCRLVEICFKPFLNHRSQVFCFQSAGFKGGWPLVGVWLQPKSNISSPSSSPYKPPMIPLGRTRIAVA